MYGVIAIILCCSLLAGLLTIGLAAHNRYHVHPDDIPCLQPPCHTLEYFTNNSDEYFVSDTTLLFGQGEYDHTLNHFTIQNVTNFSLIGTPNTNDPTSPVSVIICLSDHRIYFYNVTNLLIKHFKFEECGGLEPSFSEHKSSGHYWAAMFFHYCSNVTISNAHIYNPVGYGILTRNVMGNNRIVNVTIVMGRQNGFDGTCYSDGAYLWYENVHGDIDEITFSIDNIILKDDCESYVCDPIYSTHMLKIVLKYSTVTINITNSHFTKWNGSKNIELNIDSLSPAMIYFYKCKFISNIITGDLIDFRYDHASCICAPSKLYMKVNVIFDEVIFLHTEHLEKFKVYGPALVKFSFCLNHKIHIRFNNVKFYNNMLPILKVTMDNKLLAQKESSVLITTVGYFIVISNHNPIYESALITLTNVQIHFNGITKFIDNSAAEIIHLSFSILRFSNTTMFCEHQCMQIISLNCKLCYFEMSESANVTLSNNAVFEQIIGVPTRTNHPYPYCLFQYYSSINSTYKEFQINLINNEQHQGHTESIHDTIHQLTSDCKWATGTAFQNITPKIVNKEIISLGIINNQYQLGDHTMVCYCPPSSHYNCSVDQLGPVYPGENLTVDLCLPYNEEEFGVMYVETYNNNLPNSSCKIYNYNSMKHIFQTNQSKVVNFPIASEQPTVCELFLTAQPNLFTFYNVFYVHLLPCPLGFTLQHGICDCDPDLRKYIDECMISSETVRRLSNVYISGIESGNTAGKYMISGDCPIHYCLPSVARINLHHPDAQCQPHRTGLLCSQCTGGYSVVFGSNQCKRCSNLHLLFIIYFAFSGFFLAVLLFILNLTVTLGTINGFTLHVNMIWINSPLLHLQSRLVTVLYSYIYTANLGPSFEICFYNGMNMFTKIWIQLTYSIYLILIATTFIIGSRYSSKLYRLTFNRALPVLATLFMLTYTSILQAISSAPLYTTIITIPSHSSKNLWLLDPTIPLFGWKFLLLISVCLLLFLFLLMVNALLLFTKPLMRFKVVHRFKPIIDAFQGPFKYQYYYWIGIQMLIRNVTVLFSVLSHNVLSITLNCIIIVIMAIIQGYIQPYKNKLINIQELLLLCNFSIMCILLIFNGNETMNIITVNVMVGLSFLNFLIILVYHVFTFVITIHCTRLTKIVTIVWNCVFESCFSRRQREIHNERFTMEIPKSQYNFANFQEPLIGEN